MSTTRNSAYVCNNCGVVCSIVQDSYQYTECGLENVKLKRIELIKCPNCKNVDPVLPRMRGLLRCIAFAVAGQPYLLRGKDMHFLRQYLRMTIEEFASVLAIDKTILLKRETGSDPAKIGQREDRLLRVVALSLGEGLKERIEEIVRAFPKIEEEYKDFTILVDVDSQTYEYIE